MKERIKKSVVGFAVMGVIAASGLLILPTTSEAGVKSSLLKPLPAGNVSSYHTQAKAPNGEIILRPEEKGNHNVTPTHDNCNTKIAPPRKDHRPNEMKRPANPGRGNGAKPNPSDDEFWRKNGGKR
jgi:hypothetical protein